MSRRKPARLWMLAGSSLFVALAAALFLTGRSDLAQAQVYCAGPVGDIPEDPSSTDPIVTARKRDGEGPPNAERYFAPLTPPPKTQAALDQVGEINWTAKSLESAIAEVSAATGVEFQLSPIGLEEAAITPDAEVTFRSSALTYARALRALLTDLDLAYVLYDDYVLVTSREAAENLVETRAFALEDHPLLRRFRDGQLVETICAHIEQDEWPQYSGVGASHVSVIPGALVVTTNQATHEKVAAFLAQYARILAEYDPAESAPPADPFGSPEGGWSGGNAVPATTAGGFQ